MLFSPLEQFSINRGPLLQFWIFDFTVTNSAMALLIAVAIITYFTNQAYATHFTWITTGWRELLELIITVSKNMINENIGKEGRQFFPILLTLFILLLTLNLTGMVPYFFSVNAHPAITIGLSITVWLTVTYTGFANYGMNYFAMFMPSGAPMFLGPFLVWIEIVSYLARAVSLGLRLAANVTSGHILLVIISGFAWKMILGNILIATGGIFAIGLLLFLAGLELAVAFVQAYVFTLLTTIYLNDAVHLH